MKKRLLSVIALILAALMLCSCAGNVITGDGTDTDTSDTTTASSTSDTSADTSADTSDDPADTSDTTEAETTVGEDTSGTTSEPETTSSPETTDKGGETTTAAETTTAPEDEPLEGSEGLEYELKGKSYTVIGIGTCTDAELVVPSRYMGKPVTAIAPGAFRGCDFITSVYTPDSVTSIGKEAFADCPSIVSLDLGCLNGILHRLFAFATDEDDDIEIPDDWEYGIEDWSPCPDDDDRYEVMTFGGYEHEYFWFLIPKSLKKVSVRNGTLPDELIKMSYGCADHIGTFFGFRHLEEITVPDGLTSVSPAAFSGCVSLKYNEENGMSFIGSGNNPRLILMKIADGQAEKVTVPDGCRIIGSIAKADCAEGSRSIYYAAHGTFGDISRISDGLFQGNNKLKSISLPDGLLYIGCRCFENCTALASLAVPDSVAIIENYAFSGCTSLKEITLPKTFDRINPYLFSGCTSLSSVNMSETLRTVGSYAFSDCASLSAITLPETLLRIGSYAFFGCSSLTELHIPDGVCKIKECAFGGCDAMTELNIPKSLSAEDSWSAFLGCNPQLCAEYGGLHFIGTEEEPYKYYAGVADSKRKTYEVPEGVVGIIIPYSQSTIGEMTIPKSLKHFGGSIDGVSEYIYAGTSEEWLSLDLHGIGWFSEITDEDEAQGDSSQFKVICTDRTFDCEIEYDYDASWTEYNPAVDW